MACVRVMDENRRRSFSSHHDWHDHPFPPHPIPPQHLYDPTGYRSHSRPPSPGNADHFHPHQQAFIATDAERYAVNGHHGQEMMHRDHFAGGGHPHPHGQVHGIHGPSGFNPPLPAVPLVSPQVRYHHYPPPEHKPSLPALAPTDPTASERDRRRSPIKRKPRRSSTTRPPATPITEAPAAMSTPRDKNKSSSNDDTSPPAVLVREKKQKACANCRRAKLKCILEPGEADCVRCKSRKERCVFYPRSHDEDWQQTVTTDVYSAISYLTHLSSTVHHMMGHLAGHGIVPPLPGPELMPYQPGERCMNFLQGWGFDKAWDPSGLEERKRKRGDAEGLQISTRRLSLSTSERTFVPLDGPVRDERELNRGHFAEQAQAFAQGSSSRQPMFGAMIQNGLQLTPISVSEHLPQQRYEEPPTTPLQAIHPSLAGEMPPPPIPNMISQQPVSPVLFSNITPSSLPSTSPVQAKAAPDWSLPQDRPDTGETISTIEPHDSVSGNGDDNDYGSADVRASVITKGIIPAGAAKVLVTYFHQWMAPHLFGFHLELHAFPYMQEGPRYMTPFILAVECLLASRRYPEYTHYYASLSDAVIDMLIRSPSESWWAEAQKGDSEVKFQIGDGSGPAKDPDAHQSLVQGFQDKGWNPELGIGPEEIVAACVLSLFIIDRSQAKTIANYAFHWARGWGEYLQTGNPQLTYGEMFNAFPARRIVSDTDIARVWLFSYIVSSQEDCPTVDVTPPQVAGINRWSTILLPESAAPSCDGQIGDILLVFTARLMSYVQSWQRDRGAMCQRPRSADGSGLGPSIDQCLAHKRLGTSMNARLDMFQCDLEAYALDREWTRQIEMDWLNAKMLVNSVMSKNVYGGTSEERARNSSRTFTVDAAVQLLQIAVSWQPSEMVCNLPYTYMNMIERARCEILEALQEVDRGTFPAFACPTSAKEAMPLVRSLSDILLSSKLVDAQDFCVTVGTGLRQTYEKLSLLAGERK